MLITSIPFDENFTIYIDGKETVPEKVNTSFLGVNVENGIHDIEMIYHSPGLKAGKMVSVFGLLLFFFYRKLQLGNMFRFF